MQSGLLIPDGDPAVLNADVGNEELGQAVIAALGRTRDGLPTNYKIPRNTPLFKAAGVRSLTAFAKTASSVLIMEFPTDLVTFTPTKNIGRGSYLYLGNDQTIETPSTDPAELGRLLHEAVLRCTWRPGHAP